jgi:outer membrane protein assembly factor BamB
VGGGALLLLLLTGALVWYLVRTGTGDAQLLVARQAYDDGAYAQAVQAYRLFIDAHADHDEISAARVHLGLAEIRRSLDSGASFEDVLQQARQVIAEIEEEPSFNEAGRELAAILPIIAKGLAQRASEAELADQAAALTAQTEEALALLTNTKYVPKSFRPVETIDDIRTLLANIQQRRVRQQDIAAAVRSIAAAVEERQFQQAHAAYADLVRSHADVAELPEIVQAAQSIAEAEVAWIRYREEARPAVTEDYAGAAIESLLLTAAVPAAAADTGEAIAFTRIAGAVYGIDAATGQPLWRRYVGVRPDLVPLATDKGDVLVIDVEHGELLRLAGRTGKLLWRQAVGEVVGNAVIHAGRVFIATADARLSVIDLATGKRSGFIQFAQPIATPPSIDPHANRLVVVGEQLSIYLLSADSLQSEGAALVGHAAGSVEVPVIALADTICLAENFAARRSRLHVLTLATDEPKEANDAQVVAKLQAAAHEEEAQAPGELDQQGDAKKSSRWTAAIEPIRFTGRVTTPLTTHGRRIALATDQGEIHVYEIPLAAEGLPLSPVAARDATEDEAEDRFLALGESDLWLADSRLTHLSILSTGGRLQSLDLPRTYLGDAFVHPLVVLEDRLIHVRRPQGTAGYLVAATELASGEPLWERELAAPPTDVSVLRGESGVAVALANGKTYGIRTASLTRHGAPPVGLEPIMLSPGEIGGLTSCGKWLVARSLTADEILYACALDQPGTATHSLTAPGRVAAAPTPFAGGLIVPLQIGQVFLLDPANGSSLAAPFQPALNLARLPQWTSAAVIEMERMFAIADRAGTIYLVELHRDPARLSLVVETQLSSGPIVGELCRTATSVCAATADRRLHLFSVPELSLEKSLQLNDDLVWGPFCAAGLVVFATADLQLHCLDADGRVLAEASISAAAVGRPFALDGESLAIALEDGSLLRIVAGEGSVETLGSIGQPIAAGPVRLAGSLYVVTSDGALIAYPLKAAQEAVAVTALN